MSDDQNQEQRGVLHYRVDRLEESDGRQWVHIDDHNRMLQEMQGGWKVIRIGAALVGMIIFGGIILAKYGWERLFDWLTR